MTVHRFGIRSSVWCRAEIFDLDQAAFRSGCPHCSFMYESFPTETTLWYLRPAQTRSTCASAQSMYRGGLIWVYAYRQKNALCQQAVWILRFKTAEILISLRFSHLNSVHFNFEERDYSGSNKNKRVVTFWSIFGQLVYLSAVKWRGLLPY